MSSNSAFRRLLEPGQIGRVKLENRMVRTAAGMDYLDRECYTKPEQELPFYQSLARGGVGLIILGGALVEFPLGAVHPGQLRFDDDKFMPGYKEIANVVHKYDCPIFVQLHHAGAWRGIYNFMANEKIQPVSSSALSRTELQALGMDFGIPLRELTVAEIKEQINKWANAAEMARKTGFDGIEVNVATCHLGNSFLSPVWNRRHDEYGVDNLENRARFTVEIIQAARQRLGQDFPVGVLMNGAEFGTDIGITPQESREFAKMFEKAGADFIHVRSYGYGEYYDLHWPETVFHPTPPKPLAKPLDGSHNGAGAAVPLAAGIKQVVSVPVIAVGRLGPELGEKILRQGKADFIGMQRRLIADQELPNKVAAGRLEDIAPCLACFSCHTLLEHGDYVRCRINAAVGGIQDYAIEPAPKKKRVAVVGGGPAGMEAARVAALRGHEVTLYEKESKLGGLLRLAAIVKYSELEDFEDIIRYLKTQLTKLGVNIELGQEFNPSFINENKPDVLIIATGGTPAVPEIPGIENRKVLNMPKFHQMLRGYLRFCSPGILRALTKIWMPIGKRVVIIGGGIYGCELTEFLVKRGRKVTMVDTAETLEDDRVAGVHNQRFFSWAASQGVVTMSGVNYQEITDKGLTITTKEGQKQTIEADSIIPVSSLEPNDKLFRSLQGKLPEVYAIGDSSEPGLVMDAIAHGYRIARGI